MNPDDSFPQEVLGASYETTALEIIDREGGLNEQALVDAIARAIPYVDGARVEQWLGQTGWRLVKVRSLAKSLQRCAPPAVSQKKTASSIAVLLAVCSPIRSKT